MRISSFRCRALSAALLVTVAPFSSAAAQQAAVSDTMPHFPSTWFSLLELPFIILAIGFSFLNARAFRGGRLGRGMSLLAWGFVIMGIGHLLLMTQQLWGLDLLSRFFGSAGQFLWLGALAATWVLSGLGFYSMYQVSRAPAIEQK